MAYDSSKEGLYSFLSTYKSTDSGEPDPAPEPEDTRPEGEIFKEKYTDVTLKLMRYVPWLESVSGKDVAADYDGSLGHSALSFPVYDGTLMSLIRELKAGPLMDRNYIYAYTRRHIRTKEEEVSWIEKATVRDADYLKAVLSRYVMEGQRKTGRWQEAVERRLFLSVILKFKNLIEKQDNTKLS